MANQDPIFLAIKWSLVIISVISAVYICIFFLEYLFDNARRGLNFPLVISSVLGFLIAFLGAYAGYKEDYNLLIIFGVVLIVNIIIASFAGGQLIYRANLGLYVVSIILAFLLAFFVRRGGNVISAA